MQHQFTVAPGLFLCRHIVLNSNGMFRIFVFRFSQETTDAIGVDVDERIDCSAPSGQTKGIGT